MLYKYILDEEAVMNKLQIAEIKSSIRTEYETKINKLKEEMEVALSALSRVEETLYQSNLIQSELPIPTRADTPPVGNIRKVKGVPSRVNAALSKMYGEFKSRELWDVANNEGDRKKISRKNFAPCFSDLKKSGKIVVIKEPMGNNPGIYKRVEIKTQAYPSSVRQDSLV